MTSASAISSNRAIHGIPLSNGRYLVMFILSAGNIWQIILSYMVSAGRNDPWPSNQAPKMNRLYKAEGIQLL